MASEPGGSKRQYSLGPRSPELEAIIARYREKRESSLEEVARIERLARLLKAARW